ncbi:hypothetical protein [Microbulbifer sp. THAF38]|uniref:hypothetical protein n=1 Tax=Microbulbifer sp. THAF38 TaxID=2587856 RepID=UPI0012684F53|nr:hypothetical protein [Microbulbifer sp. THAF38]
MSLIRDMEGIMTGTPDTAGITGTEESTEDTRDTTGIKEVILDTTRTKGAILDTADINGHSHRMAVICGLKPTFKAHRVL